MLKAENPGFQGIFPALPTSEEERAALKREFRETGSIVFYCLSCICCICADFAIVFAFYFGTAAMQHWRDSDPPPFEILIRHTADAVAAAELYCIVVMYLY